MSDVIIISIFVVLGIALVIAEVLFIPGTTFVGLLGFLLIAFGVWRCFDTYGKLEGISLASASLITMALTFYAGYKKGVWKKFALNTENDVRLSQKALDDLQVGQQGITISVLRPSGTADFDGKRIEVQSLGEMIDVGRDITIVEIRGNEVFVTLNRA
jgi:membrane-bound ClpP family serine protease